MGKLAKYYEDLKNGLGELMAYQAEKEEDKIQRKKDNLERRKLKRLEKEKARLIEKEIKTERIREDIKKAPFKIK